MVDWLLKGEPRQVQIEALRRSYYGEQRFKKNPELYEDEDPVTQVVRDGPAKSWGHLLEMRLGKTPIALNEFELYRRDHGFKWAIIVAPNSYKLDWPLESERFGLSVPAFAFNSNDRDAAARWINKNPGGGLISVNYEALAYDATMQILQGIANEKTYIVGDESITIKTPNSAYAIPAIELAKLCGARRVLSGKPMSQGPQDLWAQLRFMGAISGFGYYAFKNTFCKMGGFQGKKVVGTKNEQRLHEILNENSFLARRVDWLKTPGRDYSERTVELTSVQIRHYKQMQDSFLTELENGTLVVADQIITKLIKLQQISSGFLIDENGTTHDLVPLERNPKILAIKHAIENEIEGKTVVFCHHTKAINNLAEALKRYNPAVIKGNVKSETIVAEKLRFNTDPNCRVCIGQIQATRYGHNLMGAPDDPCYTELWFENNYSLNDRSQCEERTQGAGQQYPVSIIDFIATPHDLAPIRALQRKEDVAALCLQYDRATGILPPRPALPMA